MISIGAALGAVQAEQRARFRPTAGSTWRVRGKTPPPREISFCGRSRPRSSAAARTAAARSAKLAAASGVRVEEDVAVVEGGQQADVPRQQHAVAEHVAGHVADADDGEVGLLDVDAELAEVPLDHSQAPRAVMPIFLWS